MKCLTQNYEKLKAIVLTIQQLLNVAIFSEIKKSFIE